MALCRGNEADGAVAMFMVVPLNEHANPLPCGKEIFKRLTRISGSVFQCLEQRFRVRIIVADRRTTKRRRDAQRFTSAQILAPVFSRRDPMAAEQWIHGLNLPAEQKRQLLKLQPERRATLAHPPTRYRL